MALHSVKEGVMVIVVVQSVVPLAMSLMMSFFFVVDRLSILVCGLSEEVSSCAVV